MLKSLFFPSFLACLLMSKSIYGYDDDKNCKIINIFFFSMRGRVVFYKSCHLIERVVLSDPALSQRALSYGLRDMSTNISLFGFVVNFHKYVLFCRLSSI